MPRFKLWLCVLVVVFVGATLSPQADAFIRINVLGEEEDTGTGGDIVPTPDVINLFWPTTILDTNGDGVVDTGPQEDPELIAPNDDQEGIPIIIEVDRTADSVTTSFLPTQIDTLREGFNVWENVSNSVAAFALKGSTTFPLLVDPLNGINLILMEFEGEDQEVDFDEGVLAVTFLTVRGGPEDGSIIIDGPVAGQEVVFTFSAGELSDVDIAFNGTVNWSSDGSTAGTVDIQGVLVHELGHFLGLAHVPWNNLTGGDVNPNDPTLLTPIIDPFDATATMFPFVFTSLDGGPDGLLARTLELDDRIAVSEIYPSNQYVQQKAGNQLIDVQGKVFTTGSNEIPPHAIFGAKVTAWQNTPDGLLAVSGALAGHEQANTVDEAGDFTVFGMPANNEYIFTAEPLTGRDFGVTFDNVGGIWDAVDNLFNNFVAEAFHTGGNRTGPSGQELAAQGEPILIPDRLAAFGGTIPGIDFGDVPRAAVLLGEPGLAAAQGFPPLATRFPSLRESRNSLLALNGPGRVFVGQYYSISDEFAGNNAWRGKLQYLITIPAAWLDGSTTEIACLLALLLMSLFAAARRSRGARTRT